MRHISPSKQSILSLTGVFRKVAEVDQASEPVRGTLGLVRWGWWIIRERKLRIAFISRQYLEGFRKSCMWNRTGTRTRLIYFCLKFVQTPTHVTLLIIVQQSFLRLPISHHHHPPLSLFLLPPTSTMIQ